MGNVESVGERKYGISIDELIRDIDDLTDVVEEDYSTLDTKINTTANNWILTFLFV